MRGEEEVGRPRRRERHGVWEGPEVKESLALGGMDRRWDLPDGGLGEQGGVGGRLDLGSPGPRKAFLSFRAFGAERT